MSYKYGPSIVTDGLVFYVDAANSKSYPGSGTTWSDLVESNDGSLINGPTFDSANGGNFDLDGSDDYVDVTGINVGAMSNFTLEAWVKPTSSSLDGTVMAQYGNSPHSFIFYWDVGDGALGFDFLVSTSNSGHSSGFLRIGTTTPNGALNAWNHVVAIYSGSTIEVYVNGASVGSSSALGNVNSISGFRIGADQNGRNFTGDIAVSKVYNKALSSSEVNQNYNALKNRFI